MYNISSYNIQLYTLYIICPHSLKFIWTWTVMKTDSSTINFAISFFQILVSLSTEDVKRLNEKLTEANTEKVKLQLKLDELQTSDVTVKVNDFSVHNTC